MERVFWLLLERDSAAVKNIMEEFQQLHHCTLLEKHHKLVRTMSTSCSNYRSTMHKVTFKYFDRALHFLPTFVLVVVSYAVKWNSE